jgi:hypothetical protein
MFKEIKIQKCKVKYNERKITVKDRTTMKKLVQNCERYDIYRICLALPSS